MIRVHSFSVAGGHPVNEDAFEVRQHPADAECWLCCLADGQGGRQGGGRAAQLACRVAMDAALQKPPDSDAWTEALGKADEKVAADAEAGYTTLIGFTIANEVLLGASCGDSAVLAISKDRKPAIVTARQFKNPPVGSGEALFVPFEVELVRPWLVLAMSDGVWKYAGWERLMARTASHHGERLVEEIAALARPPGSGEFPDDFTLVVFEENNG